uniref:Uncharacterized protein n=1 Tax=Marseillevirus LCMAC101 TaxID=2506602 RepID=A0A481YSJ5_9VIRU|nr:MAG: hypothetical protein LCMAC101_07830 [Marseillevirus LCMAC101]
MWYVPFEGPARFVKKQPCSFEENLSISPTLIVLYNIDKGSPNPKLKPFGHILSNIPGDAIFIAEELSSGHPKDISLNIENELPQILEEDTRQREAFARWTREDGVEVVHF